MPDQLVGVEGVAPLGGSAGSALAGLRAASLKQKYKMHSKLLVRSSGECLVPEVRPVCKSTGKVYLTLEQGFPRLSGPCYINS